MEQRVIKFRAWDGETMYDAQSLSEMLDEAWDTGHADGFDRNQAEYDHLNWMQFIGLQDGERKDIYEKDILRVFYRGQEFFCVVVWANQMAGWYLKMEDPKRYLEINALGMAGDETGIMLTDAFVIGNIYENPSLLTTKNK